MLQAAEAGVTLLTLPRPDEWLQAEGAGLRKGNWIDGWGAPQ